MDLPFQLSRANLIQLIGPATRVLAMTSIPAAEQAVSSQPRSGESITVETPTTAHAILEFANRALATPGASWDVKAHGHRPMELYGSDGMLVVPDPNFFGGDTEVIKANGKPMNLPEWRHPLGVPNHQHAHGMMANYRSAGLAEMALAIRENRPPAADGNLRRTWLML